MSTVKANSHQIGQSATATNNATWYQPASPDGTVRLGVGNAGATTTDVITATSTGVTVPSLSSSNTFGFKNRIINGGMVIDQRNAGAAINAAGNVYTVDRFFIQGSQTGKFNIGQNLGSVTPPTGFINYLGATTASAVSVSSGDYFIIRQAIEGLNCADLNWGTANAKTVTLSFYVYSSLTGTFSGHLTNSSSARWYPYTYTVSAANTWTYVSVTITGDTTGTWLTTNGTGIYVGWSLGTGSANQATANAWTASTGIAATGSVNVVGTNGATFYITGVQLEVGSAATSFDFRSYGQELALCQRYLPCITAGGSTSGYFAMGSAPQTISGVFVVPFPVPARVSPNGLVASSATVVSMADFLGAAITGSSVSFLLASSNAALINLAVTGATQFRPYGAYINSATGSIYFNGCEL